MDSLGQEVFGEKWEKMSEETKSKKLAQVMRVEKLLADIDERKQRIIKQLQGIEKQKELWERVAFSEQLCKQAKLLASVCSKDQVEQQQQVLDQVQKTLATQRQALDGMTHDRHRLEEAEKLLRGDLDNFDNLGSECLDVLDQLTLDQQNFAEQEASLRRLSQKVALFGA